MRKLLRRTDIGIIIGCIFVFALFSLWNPQQWFDWGTISNIGQYTTILGLLAIGQTFVILIREIDLSVGSVYGIVGITFAGLENSNISVLLSFILAILLALLIGLVNAVLVIRGKLSSMIVTLGGLFFLSWSGFRDNPWRSHRSTASRSGELARATLRRSLASDREWVFVAPASRVSLRCYPFRNAIWKPFAGLGRKSGQRRISGRSSKPS